MSVMEITPYCVYIIMPSISGRAQAGGGYAGMNRPGAQDCEGLSGQSVRSPAAHPGGNSEWSSDAGMPMKYEDYYLVPYGIIRYRHFVSIGVRAAKRDRSQRTETGLLGAALMNMVDKSVNIGIMLLTFIREAPMLKPSRPDSKREALRRQGILHLRPERVADELFQTCDFFDPNDLVQVKYEMLRRVRVDQKPIRRVAQDFGFSRLSVYHAQAAFERAGLAGLLPARRGPRRAHKLDDVVMAFVREQRRRDRSLRAVELARGIRNRFALTVHPRSIERALERGEKKTS